MKPTAGSHIPKKGKWSDMDSEQMYARTEMSATPRTDDVLDDNNYFAGSTFIALRKLCRQLEVELGYMTVRAELAEVECVEWRRLLQMSRDDREQDLVSEINDLKRQLIDRVEQTKAPYTEPKAP